MNFEKLRQVRLEMLEAGAAIADVKSVLAERKAITEVKFDPNQPRAPEGTPTGGQWTGSGGGSGQRTRARTPSPPAFAFESASASAPPPPPPRQQPRPPQTLGNLPRAASRVSLPILAGAVGIQRAAGTFAAEVSGQSKTPFLHIPYATPTVGSLPARRGGALTRSRPRSSPTVAAIERDRVDRQCSIKLELDLRTCSSNAARYGRENGDERQIYAICRATARVRYSECIKGGGIHAIKTPLYRGHNYRGG
jgi:hypothetical protein